MGRPSEAVKPGIVHLGISDFHRGHQAHFIDAILGSNEARPMIGWLGWVGWVGLVDWLIG